MSDGRTLQELVDDSRGSVTEAQLITWAGGTPGQSLDELITLRGRFAGKNLPELIEIRKGRLTYEELARKAGGTPSEARLQQLGSSSHPVKSSPSLDVMRGLAEALKVNEEDVWDAIGRSVGLRIPLRDSTRQDSPLLSGMPIGTEKLPAAFVDHILGLIDERLHVVEQAAAGETAEETGTNVRRLRAARKTTGNEDRGPRGGAKL